tara:strand:+ start:1370 stop:1915 length:546 start_codon:yes stop_codon:yes gene_type:complete
MSLIDNLPENYNTLSPISFRFDVKRLPNVSYFCQSAILPGLTMAEAERPTPFITHYVPGDKLEIDQLSLSFLVDENMANYLEILTWMRGLGFPENFNSYKSLAEETPPTIQPSVQNSEQAIVSDASLFILTNGMNVNKNIVFYDIFPTSLGALSFDSASAEITPILAEATFRARDFEIQSS